MGLDWRPMGKPKPGYEDRFNQIFRIIQGSEKQSLSLLDKLKGKKIPSREELLQEWFDIQIKSYETIKAPRVGRDAEADNWIREQYESTDKSTPLSAFVDQYNGYYVISLAKELDGVPVYIAMGQDENVFRGKFLDDCERLLGKRLYEEAYNTKLAAETLQYGNEIMAIADKTAASHNLQYLKEERFLPDAEFGSLESQVHILYAAAKWLIFYGKNGHGYEADY
jgi:hypothetical protein